MKNQAEQKSKLSIKKFQISKIKNPNFILGGNADDPITPVSKTKPSRPR
jgi:hypothetical protein|tara:strand:+ start:40873 stop:41019 length:147 start_codon:yes stop_codon:yes gene_type:complete